VVPVLPPQNGPTEVVVLAIGVAALLVVGWIVGLGAAWLWSRTGNGARTVSPRARSVDPSPGGWP
jgi:hypothetical protein